MNESCCRSRPREGIVRAWMGIAACLQLYADRRRLKMFELKGFKVS